MIWSYFQGYMGEAWTDELGIPQMAGILVGDFCFLAGNNRTDISKTGKKNIKICDKKGKRYF